MTYRLHRHVGVVVTLLVLALASACASPSSAGSPAASTPPPVVGSEAQRLSVTVGNAMSFEPSAIAVRAGQPVELTLRNTENIPHDFVLGEGTSQPVRIVANGGQTASGVFTIERPGMYTFVCSVAGHAPAGMRGMITAQ
jgi:uncharacterized cupredoxin-like copper-binding protein